jgi:hypothetical protein
MVKKESHPTLFALDGSIRCYDDGSMLQLYSQVTATEWESIVEETIKYKIFVECIKDICCPKLQEPWDQEDEWYKLQLEVSVSRMRNIDPVLVAKFNQENIRNSYKEQMEQNIPQVIKFIETVRTENRQLIKDKYGLDNDGNMKISNL